MACPGSVRAQEGMPDEQSEYAREGTACHAVAALCLESGQDAVEYVDRVVEGVEITDEHAEAIQVYLDTVRSDKEARGGKLLVERRFHLASLHPEFYGTSDCVAVGTDDVLRVYDLKMGVGKVVEVNGPDGANPQLAFYALGALSTLPETLPVGEVELIVVQPRAFHRDGPVRRARVLIMHELEQLAIDLVNGARAALEPDAPRVAGDHCTFCRAAPTCPALRDHVFDLAQLDFDEDKGMTHNGIGDRTVNPVTMDNAKLAKVLDAADVIQSWLNAVRYHAHILADRGQTIPGYKLVTKRATRKWIDTARAESDLLFVFGLDESSIFGKKLLSPAQVEKLVPKADRKALAGLYDKASSGTRLVREGAEAAEVAASAQSDFDNHDDGMADAVEW
jgi:glutaredoxin 2